MWGDILWNICGWIALLVASAIAMTVHKVELGEFSSKMVGLLFSAAAYYGVTEISEIWPNPTLKFDWLRYVVPGLGVADIGWFAYANRSKIWSEMGELFWSSWRFFLMASLAVFARYCFS